MAYDEPYEGILACAAQAQMAELFDTVYLKRDDGTVLQLNPLVSGDGSREKPYSIPESSEHVLPASAGIQVKAIRTCQQIYLILVGTGASELLIFEPSGEITKEQNVTVMTPSDE